MARCKITLAGPDQCIDGSPGFRVDVIDTSYGEGSPEWHSGEDTTCFYGSTATRALERAARFAHGEDFADADLPEVVA